MKCAYCLSSRQFRDDQILVRGEYFYICAPRGQLVEGYIAIAPYSCIRCLAHCPPSWFDELTTMASAVTEFYAQAYGTVNVVLYEQGRGGGGATSDALDRFPLHAHLCCLPVAINVHPVMARSYEQRSLAGLHELTAVVGLQPYLYVDGPDQRFVYVGRSDCEHRELASMRLKPIIAALAGVPDRANWRTCPGDRELARVIERWRTHGRLECIHEPQGNRARPEAAGGS